MRRGESTTASRLAHAVRSAAVLLAPAALALLLLPAGVVAQRVLLDEVVTVEGLTLYPAAGPGMEPSGQYYYLPDDARLATDDRGRPEFSFLRFVENVRPEEGEAAPREGEGGGVVHFLVELGVAEDRVRAAERALARERPGAEVAGPLPYRSGTFVVKSRSVEQNTPVTLAVGKAPILEGQRASVSLWLTKRGATLLWESFQMGTSDVSVDFEMEFAGVRAPQRARLEADWDRIYNHGSFRAAVAKPLLAVEVGAAFDDLRDEGAIRLVTVDADAEMQKLVATAYEMLAAQMFEPVDGTGMPSLGQLAGAGTQGPGLLDRATEMLGAARAEARERNRQARAERERPAPRQPAGQREARPETAEPEQPRTEQPGTDAPGTGGEDAAPDPRPDATDADGLDPGGLQQLRIEATVAELVAGHLRSRARKGEEAVEGLAESVSDADDPVSLRHARCQHAASRSLLAETNRLAKQLQGQALAMRKALDERGAPTTRGDDSRLDSIADQLFERNASDLQIAFARFCIDRMESMAAEGLDDEGARRRERLLERYARVVEEKEAALAAAGRAVDELRRQLGLDANFLSALRGRFAIPREAATAVPESPTTESKPDVPATRSRSVASPDAVSEAEAERLHYALRYGWRFYAYLFEYSAWQAVESQKWYDEAHIMDSEREPGDPTEVVDAAVRALSTAGNLTSDESNVGAEASELEENLEALMEALEDRGIEAPSSMPARLDSLAQAVIYERFLANEADIRHRLIGELEAIDADRLSEAHRDTLADILEHAYASRRDYVARLEEERASIRRFEDELGVSHTDLEAVLERGAAAVPRPRVVRESEGDDGAGARGGAETDEIERPRPDRPNGERGARPPRWSEASEPEAGEHARTQAVRDAAERGPEPEPEVVEPERPAAGGGTPAAPAGGGGSGGGGGAGGGAAGGGSAEAASVPGLAVAAVLELRRERRRGSFVVDLNKYTTSRQQAPFSVNIGDLGRWVGDEDVFRQMNLDQPVFRQREVAFRLDGLNAEDFGEFVNFVNVQLKRDGGVREELTVSRDEFNERGNDLRLIYGFSGEESRDAWMRYEYRVVWSLFSGLRVEEPWQRTADGAVALAAPYVRRTVSLEGDPAALEGVRAVVVRLFYGAGEEERHAEVTLRPDRGEYVGTADVLVPVGEPGYEYEVTWLYGSQEAVRSGRQEATVPILFLDPPADERAGR